jgi:hypothetical protein
MLSTLQISCAMLMLIGLAGWWITTGLGRNVLEQQIGDTLSALASATAYWIEKSADPSVSAYAKTSLLCLEHERSELLDMQTVLATGDRLSVKQLVRLEKLVAEHLAEPSMLAAPVPIAQ